MFAGHTGSDCVSAGSGGERPSKQQYTLKGVEADTIRLMRDAASKEGMKIGSWVSLRMKEAAERALKYEHDGIEEISEKHIPSENTLSEIYEMMFLIRQETEERMLRVERDLHDMISGQRAILATLLAQRK